MRHDLEGFILAYVEAVGIAAEAKDRPAKGRPIVRWSMQDKYSRTASAIEPQERR